MPQASPIRSVLSLSNPGQTYKLGRIRPVARGPRLHLRNYLLKASPTPPPEYRYHTAARAALREMYENDHLGDCVIAGIYHLLGIFTSNADKKPPLIVSKADVIRLYGLIGGYKPGDASTDGGCNEEVALNTWQHQGALPWEDDKHKIAGWISVDGSNWEEVKTAVWLFENVLFGVPLPEEWVSSQMPKGNGFVWDVAGPPNANNGHCFVGCDYTTNGVLIDTWGLEGGITPAAIAKYTSPSASVGGELYTVLSPDAISKASKKAPNGFDWSQLVADLESMRA